MKSNELLKINGIYRLHHFSVIDFNDEILINNILYKNHIATGDFKVNILKAQTEFATHLLINMLKHDYTPYITAITRINDSGGRSYIDNYYIKSFQINYQAHLLRNVRIMTLFSYIQMQLFQFCK